MLQHGLHNSDYESECWRTACWWPVFSVGMTESKTARVQGMTTVPSIKFTTFRLFPVGDPHRTDTVGLRGQVFEVDHHPVSCLGNDHRALNTCNQKKWHDPLIWCKLWNRIDTYHKYVVVICIEKSDQHCNRPRHWTCSLFSVLIVKQLKMYFTLLILAILLLLILVCFPKYWLHCPWTLDIRHTVVLTINRKCDKMTQTVWNIWLIKKIENIKRRDLPVHAGLGLGTVYVESVYSL